MIDKQKVIEWLIKNKKCPEDIVLLEQNVNKNSIPAKLIKKYGDNKPDNIIWIYSQEKRYIGMLVKHSFMANDEVNIWVASRVKNENEVLTGKEYVLVMF